jgi:hypothetical protein
LRLIDDQEPSIGVPELSFSRFFRNISDIITVAEKFRLNEVLFDRFAVQFYDELSISTLMAYLLDQLLFPGPFFASDPNEGHWITGFLYFTGFPFFTVLVVPIDGLNAS